MAILHGKENMLNFRIFKIPFTALLCSLILIGCSKEDQEPPVLLDPEVSSDNTPGTTFKVNGIEYYYISENACGISVNPYLKGEVYIPDKVGSYKIIEVGDHAFDGNEITSISLPASIQSIGKSAFENCTKLKELDFQQLQKLQSIGENAFKNSGLNSIELQKSVNSIGAGAFENTKLKNVDFQNLKNLQTIKENTFKGSNIEKLLLPESIKDIEKSAFENCNKLSEVNFQNLTNLQIIKHSAFFNTRVYDLNLSNLTKLETIEDFAFANSKSSNLYLNNCTALKVIGKNAFENNALNKIEWSNCKALTTIGSEAFKSIGVNTGCVIDFSPLVSLTKVGDGAFRESNITSPHFSVQGLGQYAIDLSQCKSLKEIPAYFMYKTCHTTSHMEFNIILPPSITKIHEMAFASTSHSIGKNTNHLVCLATTPPEAASNSLYLGKSPSGNIEYQYNIYVPVASLSSYRLHSFWKQLIIWGF